jgi:hypothetical protein
VFATGDANQSHCSPETEVSPGFRAFLPDCRAYELMTPPYRGGGNVTLRAVSPNGEHVIVKSFTGLAETENDEEVGGPQTSGAYYELSRTASGWSTQALTPPAFRFPRSAFLFASEDLSRSLWEVWVPAGDGEEVQVSNKNEHEEFALAIREASGTIAVIGPKVPPGHESPDHQGSSVVVGASAELGQVFLSVKGERKQLWPGDSTVEAEGAQQGPRSLYEYAATGVGEPVLVGVSNQGPLVGVPVNGHADLVSQCGTAFDDVSADGKIVVFTAMAAEDEVQPGHDFCGEREGVGEGTGPAVNELYARVDGSETVKISRGVVAAVFRGASEDGSKVFFTEGEDLYEYDLDAPEGQRESLIGRGVTAVAAVSGDGSHVYFVSSVALAGEANANGESASELSGEKLYGYDTHAGDVFFVAGAPGGDIETTDNGTFLVFASTRDLKGTDDSSSPLPQLFEYDAETGGVVRVSAGAKSAAGYECPATGTVEQGYDCDGNISSELDVPLPPHEPAQAKAGPTAAASYLWLSEAGVVVFGSPLALTPNAVAGVPYLPHEASQPKRGTENIYEFKTGQVYLISAADEAVPTHEERIEGLDPSGRNVFFFSSDELVPQDTSTESALYDAREDGGFAAPARGVPCSGESCQGPSATAPVFVVGPTFAPGGSESVPAPVQTTTQVSVMTAAQIARKRLASALRKCERDKTKRERRSCELKARRRYHSVGASAHAGYEGGSR